MPGLRTVGRSGLFMRSGLALAAKLFQLAVTLPCGGNSIKGMAWLPDDVLDNLIWKYGWEMILSALIEIANKQGCPTIAEALKPAHDLIAEQGTRD
jgi:hypothetical protein